jgi:hypothetical protein
MFAGRRSRLRAVFGLHSRGAPYATAPRDNNKRIAVGKIGKYVPVRPHHFDRYLIRPAGWCERLVGTATVRSRARHGRKKSTGGRWPRRW